MATAFAAFGAEVDDVVGSTDDMEVVLDDEDAVAKVDEPAEGTEENGDVTCVEAGGGFIEDEEGVLLMLHGDVVGELESLVLAAGEGGGVLTKGDVAQTNLTECLQTADDGAGE